MKKIIEFSVFLTIFLTLSLYMFFRLLFAEEIYMVENPDGTVEVVHYLEGSSKSLSQVMKDSGLEGRQAIKINPSDIPPTRADRKYWKKAVDKIGIDAAKKASDESEKQQKETDIDTVLTTLKITREDFKKLKDIE